MKVVTTVSGGLDSVTLAHVLASGGHQLVCLSFDYGQRHVKEIEFARACAARLGADHHVVDLRSVGALLTGSALTDDAVAVPEGHYTDDTMRSTVVPNRNAIMLSVAVGVAVARNADAVAAAMHGGDHPIYPDCRPEFLMAAGKATTLGYNVFLIFPFADVTKTDIVTTGARLDAPMRLTWSCYNGGAIHCGRCGTCVERYEAFRDAGVPDPTEYADTTLAEQVTS